MHFVGYGKPRCFNTTNIYTGNSESRSLHHLNEVLTRTGLANLVINIFRTEHQHMALCSNSNKSQKTS